MQRWLRLHRQRDFQRLRRDGKVERASGLMISYIPNHLAHNRYGIIAPKRIGRAVVRNRLRRQVREILRLLDPCLKQGYDLATILHPGLNEQPFHSIQRIVIGLCERADLIEKE